MVVTPPGKATGTSHSPDIRLAVVDDHPSFVRGLELLLPSATDGRATAVGSTGTLAVLDG
ncbi:hypothetical protein ACIBCR_02085 [Micromonospora echinospora]|uniref:hypothetical protein n=1 Tax=Micromonospora echinospora TaxID=1877 RepID=UPI00379C3CC4